MSAFVLSLESPCSPSRERIDSASSAEVEPEDEVLSMVTRLGEFPLFQSDFEPEDLDKLKKCLFISLPSDSGVVTGTGSRSTATTPTSKVSFAHMRAKSCSAAMYSARRGRSQSSIADSSTRTPLTPAFRGFLTSAKRKEMTLSSSGVVVTRIIESLLDELIFTRTMALRLGPTVWSTLDESKAAKPTALSRVRELIAAQRDEEQGLDTGEILEEYKSKWRSAESANSSLMTLLLENNLRHEEAIFKHEAEFAILRQEVEETQQQVEELKEANGKLLQVEKECVQLKKKVEEEKSKRGKLGSEIWAETAKRVALQNELKALKQETHEVETKREEAVEQLSTFKAEFDPIMIAKLKAQTDLADARHELETVRLDLGKTQTERDSVASELDSAQFQIRRFEAQSSDVKAKLKAVELAATKSADECRDWKKQFEAVRSDAEVQRSVCKGLKVEVDSLRSHSQRDGETAESLQNELDNCKAELQSTTVAKAELEEAVAALRMNLETVQSQFEAELQKCQLIGEDLDNLSTRVRVAEDIRDEVEAALSEAKTETAKVSAVKVSAERERDSFACEIDSLKSKVLAFEQRVANHVSDMTQMTVEKEAATEKIAELRLEMEAKQQIVNSLSADKTHAKEQCIKLQATIESLTKELQSLKDELKKEGIKHKEVQRRLDKCLSDLKAEKAESARAQSEVSHLQETLETTRSQLDSKTTKSQHLSAQLKEVNECLKRATAVQRDFEDSLSEAKTAAAHTAEERDELQVEMEKMKEELAKRISDFEHLAAEKKKCESQLRKQLASAKPRIKREVDHSAMAAMTDELEEKVAELQSFVESAETAEGLAESKLKEEKRARKVAEDAYVRWKTKCNALADDHLTNLNEFASDLFDHLSQIHRKCESAKQPQRGGVDGFGAEILRRLLNEVADTSRVVDASIEKEQRRKLHYKKKFVELQKQSDHRVDGLRNLEKLQKGIAKVESQMRKTLGEKMKKSVEESGGMLPSVKKMTQYLCRVYQKYMDDKKKKKSGRSAPPPARTRSATMGVEETGGDKQSRLHLSLSQAKERQGSFSSHGSADSFMSITDEDEEDDYFNDAMVTPTPDDDETKGPSPRTVMALSLTSLSKSGSAPAVPRSTSMDDSSSGLRAKAKPMLATRQGRGHTVSGGPLTMRLPGSLSMSGRPPRLRSPVPLTLMAKSSEDYLAETVVCYTSPSDGYEVSVEIVQSSKAACHPVSELKVHCDSYICATINSHGHIVFTKLYQDEEFGDGSAPMQLEHCYMFRLPTFDTKMARAAIETPRFASPVAATKSSEESHAVGRVLVFSPCGNFCVAAGSMDSAEQNGVVYFFDVVTNYGDEEEDDEEYEEADEGSTVEFVNSLETTKIEDYKKAQRTGITFSEGLHGSTLYGYSVICSAVFYRDEDEYSDLVVDYCFCGDGKGSILLCRRNPRSGRWNHVKLFVLPKAGRVSSLCLVTVGKDTVLFVANGSFRHVMGAFVSELLIASDEDDSGSEHFFFIDRYRADKHALRCLSAYGPYLFLASNKVYRYQVTVNRSLVSEAVEAHLQEMGKEMSKEMSKGMADIFEGDEAKESSVVLSPRLGAEASAALSPRLRVPGGMPRLSRRESISLGAKSPIKLTYVRFSTDLKMDTDYIPSLEWANPSVAVWTHSTDVWRPLDTMSIVHAPKRGDKNLKHFRVKAPKKGEKICDAALIYFENDEGGIDGEFVVTATHICGETDGGLPKLWIKPVYKSTATASVP